MYRDATMALPTHMLPAFLHLAVGAEGVTELRIAPDIPPKQLSGTLSWATVVAGEQPVALVDDTVMQSGRGGVLVTSHGVHLSSPRARFALGDVRGEPTYPQGRGDSASGAGKTRSRKAGQTRNRIGRHRRRSPPQGGRPRRDIRRAAGRQAL